jgi:hypothetical protein
VSPAALEQIRVAASCMFYYYYYYNCCVFNIYNLAAEGADPVGDEINVAVADKDVISF